MKAKTKWFNVGKGFGFLIIETGKFRGREVFVHYTALVDDGFKTLSNDQKVTCEVLETERGLQAANVKKSEAV